MMDSYEILVSLNNKFTKLFPSILNSEEGVFTTEEIKKNFSHFLKDNSSTYKDKSKLKEKFKTIEEIELLRKNEKFKNIGRNLLGVKKFDDWINNLEIGNVMHLNPITPSELT